MPQLSLARIMYGTGEDSRTPNGMNSNAFSSGLTSATLVDSSRASAAPQQDTLGILLQKAWAFLSTKH